MVAISEVSPPVTQAPVTKANRTIGLVPSASMLTGAVIATVWFWIPLSVIIIGFSSIPSVIGFVLAVVVFIYLIRGVERVERVRSEAVFGLGIGVQPRHLRTTRDFSGGRISCGST